MTTLILRSEDISQWGADWAKRLAEAREEGAKEVQKVGENKGYLTVRFGEPPDYYTNYGMRVYLENRAAQEMAGNKVDAVVDHLPQQINEVAIIEIAKFATLTRKIGYRV